MGTWGVSTTCGFGEAHLPLSLNQQLFFTFCTAHSDNGSWEPMTFQRARDTSLLYKYPLLPPAGIAMQDGNLRVSWSRPDGFPKDGKHQTSPAAGPAHTQVGTGAFVELSLDGCTETVEFSSAFLRSSCPGDTLQTPCTGGKHATASPTATKIQGASLHELQPARKGQTPWVHTAFDFSACESAEVLPGLTAHSAYWHEAASGKGTGIPSNLFGSTPEEVYARPAAAVPTVPLGDLQSDSKDIASRALFEWLRCIHVHGFGCVSGVDATDEATEAVCRLISFPRPTMYDHGGMWRTEVRPVGNDTAYQAIPLPAHTDGTYFQDAPGLQVFHCIQNDESGGGASLLVDGFAVAARLQKRNAEAFQFFASTELPFRFLDEGHSYLAWRRVFEMDGAGRLVSFNFNNDDRAPLVAPPGAPSGMVEEFYEHLPALLDNIRDASCELWFQLTPGLVMVFDNRRLLHGRSGFDVRSSRVLSGCYINEEEWRSKLEVLQAQHAPDSV